MVLCSVECVQRVSQYLRIPPGNLYMSENNILASDDILPNQCVEGFSAIVQALIMNSTSPARHLGSDTEKQALTRQWLEYAVLRINYADNVLNSKRILSDLNDALKSSPFITGTEMTLADVVSYHLLHGIVKDLSQQEKAQFVNISRWFDNIQQDDKIRQKLQLVNFDLLNLYL